MTKTKWLPKTAEFIDERIKIINGELGTTEQELETFKRDAGLTDLKSDAQLALSENSEYEKKRAENSTQLRLVQFLAAMPTIRIMPTKYFRSMWA